jgi:light-regulated signal transduction histidine kinase (bacteriophytochrome)
LFQNLIANGLRYRAGEKPLINVYSTWSDTAPFLEIHVSDNGIGFDECYLDKIFKPFQNSTGRRRRMKAPEWGWQYAAGLSNGMVGV